MHYPLERAIWTVSSEKCGRKRTRAFSSGVYFERVQDITGIRWRPVPQSEIFIRRASSHVAGRGECEKVQLDFEYDQRLYECHFPPTLRTSSVSWVDLSWQSANNRMRLSLT